jgi:large subunit ribosomal protein L17
LQPDQTPPRQDDFGQGQSRPLRGRKNDHPWARAAPHDRRLASARLHQDTEAIKILFNDIAPTQKERRGGYTRIVRMGQRQGDSAQTVILEFVDVPVPEAPTETTKPGTTEAKAPEKVEEKKEEQAAAAPV